MDLKDFAFPKLGKIDLAFPTIQTDNRLLQEAKDRGFYDQNTDYNKLFKELFYNGGRVVFKKDIDESFKENAWPYCRSFMQSFSPRHEDKEAICALIMSELLEPNLQENNKSK